MQFPVALYNVISRSKKVIIYIYIYTVCFTVSSVNSLFYNGSADFRYPFFLISISDMHCFKICLSQILKNLTPKNRQLFAEARNSYSRTSSNSTNTFNKRVSNKVVTCPNAANYSGFWLKWSNKSSVKPPFQLLILKIELYQL